MTAASAYWTKHSLASHIICEHETTTAIVCEHEATMAIGPLDEDQYTDAMHLTLIQALGYAWTIIAAWLQS